MIKKKTTQTGIKRRTPGNKNSQKRMNQSRRIRYLTNCKNLKSKSRKKRIRTNLKVINKRKKNQKSQKKSQNSKNRKMLKRSLMLQCHCKMNKKRRWKTRGYHNQFYMIKRARVFPLTWNYQKIMWLSSRIKRRIKRMKPMGATSISRFRMRMKMGTLLSTMMKMRRMEKLTMRSLEILMKIRFRILRRRKITLWNTLSFHQSLQILWE